LQQQRARGSSCDATAAAAAAGGPGLERDGSGTSSADTATSSTVTATTAGALSTASLEVRGLLAPTPLRINGSSIGAATAMAATAAAAAAAELSSTTGTTAAATSATGSANASASATARSSANSTPVQSGSFLTVAFLASEVGTGQEVVESLPSSLFDVATAMIDRLDPTDALVVKVASVVGDVFTADTLLQLKVLPEGPDGGAAALEESLQSLCASHLLTWVAADTAPAGRTESFAFNHALVRHTAYGMLLHSHRRQLHFRVARILSRSADAPSHLLQLAHHWLRVVEDPPSDEELDSDYGGAAGWQSLLLRALATVCRALQQQLLSIGLYQEGEVTAGCVTVSIVTATVVTVGISSVRSSTVDCAEIALTLHTNAYLNWHTKLQLIDKLLHRNDWYTHITGVSSSWFKCA
jgi:hypothetical protein